VTAVARRIPQPLPAPVVPPASGDETPARKVRKQAWLALHFEDWPLHVVLHMLTAEQRVQLAAQPLVVLDQDRQRHVLVANEIAQRGGIRAGHTLNAAMALCAELKSLPRDVRAEARLLQALAAWAQRYTPVVSIETPNELLLEVRGSLRLFGGVQQFIGKVQQEMQNRQLSAAMALSPTARASLCLARRMAHPCTHAGGATVVTPRRLRAALASLPLACLYWPAELQLRMSRCGVTQIGELWRLPRADLARRIGKRHLRELDALLGKQVEVRASFRQIMPYTEHLLLDFEITSVGLLEPVLIRALEHLQAHLRERDLALGRLYIELLHRSVENRQPATRLCLGLATPSGEMQRMTVVLREQLARLQLAAPVQEIQLHAPRLLAAQGVTQDLLAGVKQNRPPESQTELLARLLERLQARLGMRAVRCLQLQTDYRPEHAQSFKPAGLDPVPASCAPPTGLCARPLWLLSAPLMLGSGSRPPSQWQIMQGPERIEAGWWDAASIRRDYYIARYRTHAHGWVFRDLLKPSDWYLHGWFA
jgi:protein ImuB